MQYKTATILFRDGEDDFTLWVVDLPEDRVMKFERSECAIVGEINSLLSQDGICQGVFLQKLQIVQ